MQLWWLFPGDKEPYKAHKRGLSEFPRSLEIKCSVSSPWWTTGEIFSPVAFSAPLNIFCYLYVCGMCVALQWSLKNAFVVLYSHQISNLHLQWWLLDIDLSVHSPSPVSLSRNTALRKVEMGEGWLTERQGNFVGDGCVHYLNCLVSQVHIFIKTYQIVYFNYIQCVICQLYLNKTIKK